MERRLTFGCVISLALSVTACSPTEQITRDRKTGEIKVLTKEEAKAVCQTQFCEPNYTYTASFGKKRKRPAPIPSPSPSLPAEADYSRAIIKAQQAWNTTQGARDVVVAVIDTGVELDHPDLAANISQSGYDFTNNREGASDDNGHGTHVAGIIAAELNGVGTVGVAPRVKILPVKFLNAQGSGSTADAIRSVEYATQAGANILSMSWGGGGESQLLNDALQVASRAGILLVAAAGNEAQDFDARPSFPAAYAGVISVASTDEQDRLSSFSNHGLSVTISAPGSNIFSSYLGHTYKKLSGTSMATPQVSGALALALSVVRDPALARQALCASAEKILLDAASCGRLDVARLVARVASH